MCISRLYAANSANNTSHTEYYVTPPQNLVSSRNRMGPMAAYDQVTKVIILARVG